MSDYVVCYGCGISFTNDEITWATEDGKLTTMEGNPYCDGCLPEEDGDEPQGCSHCFNPDFSCACTGGVGRQTQVEVEK